jgi:hypothetical protein
VPHAGVRHDQRGIGGAPRGGSETLEGGGAPSISRRVGARVPLGDSPCRPTLGRGPSCRSAGIDKSAAGGPEPHHDAHRGPTGRTAGHTRGRGRALRRLALAGVPLHDQQAEGIGRDGTACLHKAEVPDFHAAMGEDMLEESAEKLDGVEGGGA